jgi:hypothetical protein
MDFCDFGMLRCATFVLITQGTGLYGVDENMADEEQAANKQQTTSQKKEPTVRTALRGCRTPQP